MTKTDTVKDIQKIVNKMLYYQKVQTGKADVVIFRNNMTASKSNGGFNWTDTEEGPEEGDRLLTGIGSMIKWRIQNQLFDCDSSGFLFVPETETVVIDNETYVL